MNPLVPVGILRLLAWMLALGLLLNAIIAAVAYPGRSVAGLAFGGLVLAVVLVATGRPEVRK